MTAGAGPQDRRRGLLPGTRRPGLGGRADRLLAAGRAFISREPGAQVLEGFMFYDFLL